MRKFLIFLALFMQILKAEEISVNFDVYAKQSAKLVAQSVGVVAEILKDKSDFVKKGDMILALDDSAEQIALKSAENELKLAEISFNHAKSLYEKFKAVKNVTSKQDYENAKFSYESAKNSVQKAKIAMEKIKDLIDKKRLIAPFDGVIDSRFVEVGEGVGGVAQPLILLNSYPNVKIVFSFDEQFKDKISTENFLKFNYNGKEFRLKISKISPSIDMKTRKITAEIFTQNITPGTFGVGTLEIK